MNNKVFNFVANSLSFIGRSTRLSYNQVNIVVYYFIIPFSWLCLLDVFFNFHYLKITVSIFTIGFIVGCRNFNSYSDWLFYKSLIFLNYFNKYGSSYVKSSVLICVFLPIIVYAILLLMILNWE